eukprot:4125702-Pyramimonas_sp.AAC.3
MSVMENIRMSRPDATDEECELAARRSCLIGTAGADYSLPAGLHTKVEQGGRNLSIGQVGIN